MKKISLFALLLVLIAGGFYLNKKYVGSKHRIETAEKEVNSLTESNAIQSGDLIFQTSRSAQSQAIQVATGSKYSHCGIIFKQGNNFYVFEAVQPVKTTALGKWITNGKEGKFLIKRIKNADQIITPAVLKKMKEIGAGFNAKNYDLTFEWSDDKMYCSELIWKIYQRATGLEIGKLQKLRDFDLSNEVVKKKMEERYGTKIPLDEWVISPVAIVNSDLLVTVAAN